MSQDGELEGTGRCECAPAFVCVLMDAVGGCVAYSTGRPARHHGELTQAWMQASTSGDTAGMPLHTQLCTVTDGDTWLRSQAQADSLSGETEAPKGGPHSGLFFSRASS